MPEGDGPIGTPEYGARVLGERYELDSLLGSGGMGQVFRATDRVLDRTVAVKVLAPRLAKDQRAVGRFRREAKAAAALQHRNVVQVFDTGSSDGTHFIVMEYLEGRTLSELLREEGPLRPERSVAIAKEIALGLAAAHEKGFVHRDVKPGNVTLRPDDEAVKVMDFGIARTFEDDQRTGSSGVFGTAAYVSPEQVLGRRVDPRSDVYSLGCVLYEMLTGRTPFGGETAVAVGYKHVHEEPKRPSDLNPEVPPAVEGVVMRALEKEPAARYRDAGEMVRALEGLGLDEAAVALALGEPTAESAPVEAGDSDTAPIAPVEEGPRRKVPVAWLAAALAILAAAILLPVFLFGNEPTSSVPDTAEAAERVRVPDVLGFSEDDAIRRLSRVGLTAIALGDPLGDEVQATVVSQDPEPGTLVRKGSEVTITLQAPGAESPSPSPAAEEEPEEEEPPPERPSPRARPSPSPPSSPSPSPEASPPPDGGRG